MPNNSEGISTKVGVKGDKEYKSALQQISRQLTVLNTDMKASQTAFGNQAETMDGMHDRLEKLNEIYEVQAKKVELIREQLEKAKTEYGENSRQADELQIALNRATAQMNSTGNQIKQTEGDLAKLADAEAAMGDAFDSGSTTVKDAEQAMKDMAKETGSASEAAEDAGGSMEDAGSAAEDASGGVGSFTESLLDAAGAVGGGFLDGVQGLLGALGSIGSACVEALGEAFDLAKDAGKYADDLMTLSSQVGVDTDKLQQWQYSSNFIDTSVDTITGSLTKLTKKMASAQEEEKDNAEKWQEHLDKIARGEKDTWSEVTTARDAFTKLGVSWKDYNGNLRDNEEVFMDLIDALGKIENPVERDALAMDLFGKSAKELNPLIEAGSRAWRDMGKEAEAMGTVFSEDNLEIMGSFDDTMQKFNATADAMKKTIGLKVIPMFDPLVNAAGTGMGKVAKALQDGLSGNALAEVLDEVVNGLIDELTVTFARLDDMVPEAVKIISQVISHVAEALPELARVALPGAVRLLQAVLDGLLEITGPLAALATELVTEVAGFLIDNLPDIVDAGISLLEGLVDGIIDALPELIPAAIEMIVKLAEGLIQGIPRLVEKLPEIVSAIWDGLKETDWAGLGGEVLGSILAGLGNVGSDIMDLLGVPTDMQETIKGAWEGFAGSVGGVITGALGAVTSFLGSLFDPPAEGEQSSVSALWDSFASLVSTGITGVLGSVVSFFGSLFNPPDDGEQAATSQQWGTFAETLMGTLETGLKGAAELVSGIFTGGKAAIEAFPWEDTGTKLGTLAGAVSGFALDALSGVFTAGSAAVEAFPWEDTGTKIGEVAGQLAELTLDALSGVFDAGAAAVEAFPWTDVGTKAGELNGQLVGIAQDALSGVFTAGAAAIEAFPWSETGEQIGTLAGELAGIALDAIGGVFDAGAAAIEAFPWDDTGEKIGTLAGQATAIPLDALSGVFTAADEAITGIDWSGLGENVATLVNGVVGIDRDALAGIFTAADEAIRSIQWDELGGQVADGLSRAWGILAGVGDVALGLGEAAVGAAGQGVGALKDWIASWRNDESVENEATAVGTQVVTDVGTGVTGALEDLKEVASGAGDAVLDAIKGVLTETAVKQIGLDVDANVGKGVQEGEKGDDGLIVIVQALAKHAKDSLATAVTLQDFKTIGKAMDEGIAQGITNHSGLIETAAWNAAQAAYDSARLALDINSPSKKGGWLGEMFDLGFAGGLTDNADEIRDAMGYLNDLTAAEAEPVVVGQPLQRGMSGFEFDYDRVRDAFVEAIQETGIGDMVVYWDKDVVGQAVEPATSRATRQRQQQSVKGRTARLVMG